MEPSSKGYAPVNGINLYYEQYGAGELPLVLIHGGGSTIESNFGRMLPLLRKFTPVLALELQAHGRTNDRPAPESFTQDADDVAALLKYLGIGKANVLGFSNGGSTALQVAIRHPELVHKSICISGATKREGFLPGFFEGMARVILDDMPGPLKEAFLQVTPDPEKLKTMFEKDRDRMIGFTDWEDSLLTSIKAPTLVMAGQQDVVTLAHTLHIAEQISGAQLAILPGVHGACLGEVSTYIPGSRQPEVTALLIEDFLKDN